MSEKELLQFYKKQFDDLQKKDDKFREKVDQHMKQLITDRHELESEVLRRGEKISDLQKALVDLQLSCFEEREKYLNVSAENEKLKRNESNLHSQIRSLLNDTKDKELRDKIIYVMKDPEVEINYRCKNLKNSGSSLKKSSDEVLKQQIEALHAKLSEHSKVSQNKSEIILEDCKVALEKAKEKLLRNEEEMAVLTSKLQDAENELSRMHRSHSSQHINENDYAPPEKKLSKENRSVSDSKLNFKHHKSNKLVENLHTNATEIHLSSLLLSKILTKILSIFEKIQSSKVFADYTKQPKASSNSAEYVSETDVVQLQSYVRQSTRLSFEISNLYKSLNRTFNSKDTRNQLLDNNLDMHWELKELECAIEELAVVTAEADLQGISLSRATFFDFLTRPKVSFEKFGVKDMQNHTKYISDFNKMEANIKSAKSLISQAVKFAERIIKKCKSGSIIESQFQTEVHMPSYPLESGKVSAGIGQSKDNLGPSGLFGPKTTISSKEQFPKSYEYPNYKPNNLRKDFGGRRSYDSSDMDELTRTINKALAKIDHLEKGEYSKDNEFYKSLASQIGSLTGKLRELYDEFNVRSLQDQFSEYSALTLSKLETLAKQSRDAVIAAEAQITVHRDNSRLLSQKLKDTEELLRESIHECLVLKQKLRLQELDRETEKVELGRDLRERLHRVSDFDDLETAVKEVASSVDPGGRGSKRGVSAPFECMYCKQGAGHKQCQEKIKELRATNRKLATELKLLQQEMKEEKKLARMSQEELERANKETATQKITWSETHRSLEAKNAAIMEQLKLEKNRLRNMERFRRLEIEGFQTDIRNLKTKIQDLEKQLMKAVLIFEHDKKDVELLQTIHTTAQRSKQATAAVKRLKSKLYELETDIKHL